MSERPLKHLTDTVELQKLEQLMFDADYRERTLSIDHELYGVCLKKIKKTLRKLRSSYAKTKDHG